ncbi:MAG: UDP-N-acetylmuramate:L-alanyl-gamma-D-glutamyl-meso-diaminopimelate ligase [Verrucomicrobiales bacterium]|jgi:UDP-N-acetylmuramate: L-alanyl-gamma-D-glutamyl-meso-diaminopimelate ligase|nr:UDP-N-acetylmuramate:L-alanyl-gamma-D-glutamyl-meso-diaminopimelate ligase [Verrucomicrobiales bacterium]
MNAPIKKIHFIGICGTAMGSVAAMLKDQGFTVSGSDERVYPPMSTFLQDKGIQIMEGYRPENLAVTKPDLVVIGNAISRGNPELESVLNERYYYLSLPETLKQFFLRFSRNLVVSGTHGKTTTTSLLAWIFQDAAFNPSYMIGGIPLNLGQGCAHNTRGKHWILEGDEYDTAFFDKRSKFLHYLPELLIINNIEFDHADIYRNLDEIKLTFKRLVDIVPQNGMIVLNADNSAAIGVTRHSKSQLLEVGFSENAAIRITDVSADEKGTHFNLSGHRFCVPMYGNHNVHNTAMCITAAHCYGISYEQIAKSLSGFKGVKRRQEVRAEINGITIVDDFGHHPTALSETIYALRQRYPKRKLWALFEPRSNTTRRAVFQHELPAALAKADAVYMTQIARAEQLAENDRLNVEQVIADIKKKNVPAWYEANSDDIIAKLPSQLAPGDVVAVFSNGSFNGLIDKLITKLSRK